jgi:hypothetical protein
MFRIKNTADDRTKELLHRTASQFELEPNLGGHRIRLGTHLDITNEHYERVKPTVATWVKKGMVDVFELGSDGSDTRKLINEPQVNAEGLKLKGPTLEEWESAGYLAENYPPEGYAEVFSPGLVAYRREQEDAAVQKAVEAGAVTPAEIMNPPPPVEPPVPEQPILAPSPVPAVSHPQPQVAAQAAANKDKSKKKLF